VSGQAKSAEYWLNRSTRSLRVSFVAIVVVLVIDLTTGWPVGDWRFQALLLVAAGADLFALFTVPQLAGRARTGAPDSSGKALPTVAGISSLIGALALMVGVGYLLGGRLGAVLAPVGLVCVLAYAMAKSRRARRT
jgi:hypothetical protein